VADPREVEIELGYFNLERTRQANTITTPSVVLNYGFAKNWEAVGEFRVEASPELEITHPGLFLKGFLASALFGLGVAIVTPSTTALVADLVKAGRMGSAMGVFGTIWDCGEAAGPIFAGALIASLSYAPAFGLIATFMALVALVFLVAVKDPTAAAADRRA